MMSDHRMRASSNSDVIAWSEDITLTTASYCIQHILID
jgi:hypothetical protein